MLRKYIWMVALGLLSGSLAWADGVQKLGFIDTGRVYQESKQAQSIQMNLDKEFAAQQKRLQDMQKQGLALKNALESGKIPEAQREAKVRQMLQMDQRYKQQALQLAEEYNLRRNEEFASLQQNANKVIVNLAKKDGYDLIIQDAVFVNSKYDVTDQVIKALNEQR
ncbi:OmpH family outer membrane protein [Snodgrassella sp. CFCC 13594]|uniref:OmpH family outer membrane protein n=1 Tax=Snodgrassella sp. CFCC 13594 TaxID=1775559 RepID=UPI00082FB1B3|nr:OmpH family outer membrane protein [Snodgrassella sp. CFCC 13594]